MFCVRFAKTTYTEAHQEESLGNIIPHIIVIKKGITLELTSKTLTKQLLILLIN